MWPIMNRPIIWPHISMQYADGPHIHDGRIRTVDHDVSLAVDGFRKSDVDGGQVEEIREDLI